MGRPLDVQETGGISVRSHLKVAIAVGVAVVVLAVNIAAAEKPTTVRAGNLELTLNGGFAPTALSKTKLTPIDFFGSGAISTVDGTHPPALREFILETDKNAEFTTKGLPACRSGQLQSQDSDHARAICKGSIIGTGTGKAEIAFPEQKPIPVTSPLTIFNGGTKGGVITLFIHLYITVPTPAAIVTTVKISKIHNGRLGLKSVASVPKIAGGSGSATYFGFSINKQFTYKGKKVSVLSAKCPDGKLMAHGTAVFADGTRASASIIRTCTSKARRS
jgi:hypothetical protein